MFRSRIFAEWCLALALAGLFAWAAAVGEWTDRFDYKLQDWATAMMAGPADDRVLVVEIDNRSLGSIGPWPWPRSRHADLVDRLAAAGAQVIALDILFAEPRGEEADAALARSLRSADNVVLPLSLVPRTNAANGNSAQLPIAPLRDAARDYGHVALEFDSDGTVRRARLFEAADDTRYQHFALAAARQAGDTAAAAHSAEEVEPVIFPYQPIGSFRSVSAVDVLSGQLPPAFVEGRIVLVGATAQGLRDRYSVPSHAGDVAAGVTIHANLLNAILHGSLVRTVGPEWVAGGSLAVILALFLAFWFLHPRHTVRFAVGLWALVFGAAMVTPFAFGVWFPPGAALLSIMIAYPLWAWRRLVSVVDYLQREAANLGGIDGVARGPDGDAGMDTVARQVHRLHNLVEAVRERFALVRTVVRSAPEPMIVLNGEGLSVTMNQAARQLFGADRDGRSYIDLLQRSGAALNEEGDEITLPDERCFSISRASFDVGDDRTLGEIVQFHELTHIRQAERQRRETMQFVSHDMRSPQVAILHLVREGGVSLPAERRLELIEREAQRTLALADNFVQLARLEEQDLEFDAVELSGAAGEAADRFHAAAARKNITIAEDMPEEPVFALCDLPLLSRVLDNLIGNALKYCPDGSQVTISVGPSADQPDEATIMVADNGPGLPDVHRSAPFARYGSARELSASEPSAGLGLAFVAEAVSRMHGRIAVSSQPGKGTSFTISLPISQA